MPTTAKLFFGAARLGGTEDSYWDVMTATSGGSSVSLSWPTAGNSPVSYDVDINGTITNVGNVTSYTPSGLVTGNNYSFKVRPVFSDGSTGGWSLFKNGSPDGFNRASGGTETTISDYNGTGETWKVHTFTSDGTFSVTDSPGINPFRVLVLGGGGGGINGGAGHRPGGGGGAGGLNEQLNASFNAQSFSVTVGGIGSRGSVAAYGGTFAGYGGQSSISTYSANGGDPGRNGAGQDRGGGASGSPTRRGGGGESDYGGGGGGGTAGNGASGSGGTGGAGGAGTVSNITGANVTYGRGGNGGNNNGSSSNGPSGVVIVAYRIA